jgi:hypothetical protein
MPQSGLRSGSSSTSRNCGTTAGWHLHSRVFVSHKLRGAATPGSTCLDGVATPKAASSCQTQQRPVHTAKTMLSLF